MSIPNEYQKLLSTPTAKKKKKTRNNAKSEARLHICDDLDEYFRKNNRIIFQNNGLKS